MIGRLYKNYWIGLILLGLVLFFAAWTGYNGINFGSHWDEWKVIDSARESFTIGLFLPHWYQYPSMSYNLAILSMIASRIQHWGQISETIATELQNSPQYLVMATRIGFLLTTLLSCIWVYLLTWRWTKKWPAALFAAALLASSWEVAYHARWIAPDGLLMQAGILTMLAVIQAFLSEKKALNWLVLAALFAGLACGSKYPGGIFLLAVISAYGLIKFQRHEKINPLHIIIFLILFTTTFLFITPGALLEPFSFQNDILSEMQHYREGHSFVNVQPFTEHGWLMLQYLAGVAFSHYWPVAVFFFTLAVIGIIVSIRRYPAMGNLFLAFPLLYGLYFSVQKVMFVRNLLTLIPFIAVWAGWGLIGLWQKISWRILKVTLFVLILGLLGLNFVWLRYSADSIQYAALAQPAKDVMTYLKNHPQEQFYLTSGVRSLISAEELTSLPNVTTDLTQADQYMYRYLQDYPGDWADYQYTANRPGHYRLVSGTYAVNLDYYPFWPMPDIRCISVSDAEHIFGDALQ